MANLSPKETGLPFVIYILQDFGLGYDVRIKIARNAKVPRSKMITVEIRSGVQVIGGELGDDELAIITRWVNLNRDALIG